MGVLVLHVPSDGLLAKRLSDHLSTKGLSSNPLSASYTAALEHAAADVGLVVILMTEASRADPSFAAMVHRIDYLDLPFMTVRDGNVLPGDKIRFFVQVGQWLDIDPDNPGATFDRLADSILNPGARPTRPTRDASSSRTLIQVALASLIGVFVLALGYWAISLRLGALEEVSLQAEIQKEEALLRPESVPFYYVTEDLNLGFAPTAFARISVPDYMVGQIAQAVFFDPEGSIVGQMSPDQVAQQLADMQVPIASGLDTPSLCILFDRALTTLETRRQLMLLALPENEGLPIIESASVAEVSDTCEGLVGLSTNPAIEQELLRATTLSNLYERSNLVTVASVEADGIGIDYDTLIHGRGRVTSKLELTYRTQLFASAGSDWIELPSLEGSRLSAAGLSRPEAFFICIETFQPEAEIYLADWALIENTGQPRIIDRARPLQFGSEPICGTLPETGNVRRLGAGPNIGDLILPPGSSSTAIAGISVGMPLHAAREKMSTLIDTPLENDSVSSFMQLLTMELDQLNVLEAANEDGHLVALVDPDRGIGIAVIVSPNDNTVAAVFYAYRPNIYISRSNETELGFSLIHRDLIQLLGQSASYDGYGNRGANGEGHNLRWGTGPEPYCHLNEPTRPTVPTYGVDRSSYSLAVDPTDTPVTSCRAHAGFSHLRDFDNESMLLWMIGAS